MAENLNGTRRSAILLLALEAQQAEDILRRLPENAQALLHREMRALRDVPEEVRLSVINRFHEEITRTSGDAVNIETFDSRNIAAALCDEHPQTIALVLSQLRSDKAGEILSNLPQQKQIEVVRRLSSIGPVDQNVVREVMSVLEDTLARLGAPVDNPIKIDRTLDDADDFGDDSAVAFEDIADIDDEGMRALLSEVDEQSLCLALQASSRRLRQKMFRNMTPWTAQTVQSEMSRMGPVHLVDVETAQRSIVHAARRLEASGQIVLDKSK